MATAVARRRRAEVREPVQPGGPIFLVGTEPGSLAAVQSVIERHFLVRTSLTAARAVRWLAECRPTAVIIDGPFPSAERSVLTSALRECARECLILDDENRTPAPAADRTNTERAKRTPLATLLRRLAALLAAGQLPPGFPPPLNPRVLETIDYIGRNYGKPIGLRSAAAAGGLSPRHLAHLFRREVGISVMDYVARIRIEAAKTILAERTVPLEHVAESVGFSDASHLSRVFVQHVGERPGQFRNSRAV